MRETLVMSSALALLMGTGIAYADGNQTYNVQTGDSNSASIDQSAGSNNNVGYAADPVLQNGTLNSLTITQSGNDNSAGGDESSIPVSGSDPNAGIEQQGNENYLKIEQAGNHGDVGEITQTEDADATSHSSSNNLTINQESGSSGAIVRRVTRLRMA